MNLKLLVSAGRISDIIARNWDVNSQRYNAFVQNFNDVGLISMDDLLVEASGGDLAPVYKLERDLRVLNTIEQGVCSNLFLASGFNPRKGDMVTRPELDSVLNYLERIRSLGSINHLVNSVESTLFEDKASFVGLKIEGVEFPDTYHFDSEDDLRGLVLENGPFVVKNRFGYEGLENFLVGEENLDLLSGRNVSDYVAQEILDIDSEIRFVFYQDRFLGARKIIDRTRPWESGDSQRKHEIVAYSPTNNEILTASKFFEHSGAVVGAVDFVYLKDGRFLALEFNGVATGFGYSGGPYDLNDSIVGLLNEDYGE